MTGSGTPQGQRRPVGVPQAVGDGPVLGGNTARSDQPAQQRVNERGTRHLTAPQPVWRPAAINRSGRSLIHVPSGS